jgi:hypothetical protein
MDLGVIGNCLTVDRATCTGTGVMKTVGASVHELGDQILIVLTAVIGVAIAYFLFTWAWRKIKGSVK